jgi:hypothetical protein
MGHAVTAEPQQAQAACSVSRRPTVYLTFAGLELSVGDWAALLGRNAGTLHNRLLRGMNAEATLMAPLGKPIAPRKTTAERRAQRRAWHRDPTVPLTVPAVRPLRGHLLPPNPAMRADRKQRKVE